METKGSRLFPLSLRSFFNSSSWETAFVRVAVLTSCPPCTTMQISSFTSAKLVSLQNRTAVKCITVVTVFEKLERMYGLVPPGACVGSLGGGGGISSVCYLAQLLALPTVKILSAFLCLHKQSFHSLGHGVGQFSLIRIREPRSTLGCPRLSISMEARTHQIGIGINTGVPSGDVREACPGKRTCNSMRPMQPEGQETNQVSSNFLLSSGTAC